MYCDDVKLEADTVLATLYVAKKYIVPHLARACVTFLETSLNAKNACLLLSQSRLFEEPDLMQRCWEVIDAQVSTTETIKLPRRCTCRTAAVNYVNYDDSSEDEDETTSSSRTTPHLQRWPGGQRIDSASCAELRVSNNSLCESNCFLFDAKLQPKLCRTRSEPHVADGRLDIEVIQNITFKDSFSLEEPCRECLDEATFSDESR